MRSECLNEKRKKLNVYYSTFNRHLPTPWPQKDFLNHSPLFSNYKGGGGGGVDGVEGGGGLTTGIYIFLLARGP